MINAAKKAFIGSITVSAALFLTTAPAAAAKAKPQKATISLSVALASNEWYDNYGGEDLDSLDMDNSQLQSDVASRDWLDCTGDETIYDNEVQKAESRDQQDPIPYGPADAQWNSYLSDADTEANDYVSACGDLGSSDQADGMPELVTATSDHLRTMGALQAIDAFLEQVLKMTSNILTGDGCPRGTLVGKIIKQTKPDPQGDYEVSVRITSHATLAVDIIYWDLTGNKLIGDDFGTTSPSLAPGTSITDSVAANTVEDGSVPSASHDRVEVEWGFGVYNCTPNAP